MNGIRRRRRPAFTLIELLVVIGIIALLMVIGGSAAMRFMGGASVSATRTLLDRVGIRLAGQMAAVRDKAQREPIPDAVLQMAGSDSDRARVIYIKLRLKQAFPQTFHEALYPGHDHGTGAAYLKPLQAYADLLRERGIVRNPAAPQQAPEPHEAAACLYMALRYGPDGTSEDELGIRGSTRTISGLPCLVDAWQNPVAFCRWPTGDPSTGASLANNDGYRPGFNDPGDPRGLLNDSAWQLTAGFQAFQRVCHAVRPRSVGTLALSPALLSVGPDKLLGADPFTLQKTGAEANDNVIARRIR